MTVESPTLLQIVVAWRDNKWIVARNAVDVGAYAYQAHAMDKARTLAAEAAKLGLECYMLIRDKTGAWHEKPCPRPPRGA